MRKSGFWLIYLLLAIAQLILTNFLRLSPYLMLSILPVMVLCIPIRTSTAVTMIIAFATGLSVDLLSEGVLGLNALALVPVALCRNSILRLVFGTELFARGEDFTARRNGVGKVMLAALIANILFLALYVWVDSAGMRPFSFNVIRFGVSLAASMVLSHPVLELLAPDSRR